MGEMKATLPLGDGDTFLTRIVRSAHQAGVPDVVVVVGHNAQSVRASVLLHGLAPRFVDNPAFEAGQFSSVLAGLAAIDRPGINAMMLTLVDVPLVGAATIRAVLDRYSATRAPVVRVVRGEKHGHPVLLDRVLFDRVRASDPSAGLKPVVREHASRAGDVEVDDAGAFLDIDTPADYQRVLQTLSGKR